MMTPQIAAAALSRSFADEFDDEYFTNDERYWQVNMRFMSSSAPSE